MRLGKLQAELLRYVGDRPDSGADVYGFASQYTPQRESLLSRQLIEQRGERLFLTAAGRAVLVRCDRGDCA